METGMVFVLALCTLMFSVRSEIVITGVGMNSLCNFTKYYSCEISLNVNFNDAFEVQFFMASFLHLTKDPDSMKGHAGHFLKWKHC